MPQITFSPEHKVEFAGDFPKLKLDLGQKKRILCLEDPTYAYVHTLRAPKIVNGKAETRVVERKDKSTYVDYVKDFIGRPLCLGDLGVLQDKGVDPKNCPACKAAVSSDQVDPPQRRFAMHVIDYAVKGSTTDLAVPFSCSLVVWSFTDMVYNKLTDFVSEGYDLRKHDLLLGPCTNKDFQKFEMMPAMTAAWLADEKVKAIVVETYKENKVKDLEACCGRKVERRWMEDDLGKIAERWRIANGEPLSDPTEQADGRSLTEGLDNLLSDVSAPRQRAADEPVDLGAILSTPAPRQASDVDVSDLDLGTPNKSEAAASRGSGEAMDFKELFDSLP